MTDNALAPILLFVYNRPQHTRRLLDSLLANDECRLSSLYVYSDGARDEASASAVAEVRAIVHSVTGFARIEVIERENNMGLAANVIDGVTTQVRAHGRVIVLEDDLVLSPFFLRFMNDALSIYADEPRVGHIQACDFTGDPSLSDTFLIKFTGSWGWATWERAWRHFNPDGKQLLARLEQTRQTRRFDFNGAYRFTRMLRRQIAGKNNSWAIRWNASLFVDNILSLNVGRSLVANVGFDGSGTNCGGGNLYASNLAQHPIEVVKITPIEENMEARRCFERYYRRNFGFWPRVKRRIIRTIHGDFRK